MLLEGKVVVITGIGSGVGRATARLFAKEGAHVVGGDVQEDWGNETLRLVTEDGSPDARFVPCDVSREDDVHDLVDAAVSAHGRLDVMMNNVGVSTPRLGASFEEHDAADWKRLIDINLLGVAYGCKHALLRFKAQGDGGVIVNTGSAAGMVGWGGVPYGATKAGVIQLTRGLAIENAAAGIRVNCLCPGAIDTNFAMPPEAAFQPKPKEFLDAIAGQHPLGRPILAEDCANAALYLASSLSSNVTGVALPVDGGYLAR
ncbi:MAG: SDR family oxidoreductase [Candidatus Binatia bacterium]|nr:SDR family oxidoreductase [Candidatus Binatia bacterium]